MKQITLSGGRRITTPWLTLEEAAAYFGWSAKTMARKLAEAAVPAVGEGRHRRWKIRQLEKHLATDGKGDGDGTQHPEAADHVAATVRL